MPENDAPNDRSDDSLCHAVTEGNNDAPNGEAEEKDNDLPNDRFNNGLHYAEIEEGDECYCHNDLDK